MFEKIKLLTTIEIIIQKVVVNSTMHKYIDKTWKKLMTEWLHPKLVCEIFFFSITCNNVWKEKNITSK